MPAIDVSNPKVINFLLENYEKESRLRLKWVQLHSSKFEKAAIFTREENNLTKDDIAKAVIEAGVAATTRDHIAAARHRTTARVPDYLFAKVGVAKEFEAPMKPVAPEIQESLRENRLKYLKKRSSLSPEDKYSFVESSNWVYGWKLADSGLKMSGPAHGRVAYLLHELNGRVGAQRDPDHYNTPDMGHSLFVTI